MPEPSITTRSTQPYVAVRGSVTMQTTSEVADRLPELFLWLAGREVEPAGPPFLRYLVLDATGTLELEAGVPVEQPVTDLDPAGPVHAGELPAGRYVVAHHHGHPAGLRDATAALLDWASEQDLTWAMTSSSDGEQWQARLEVYQSDPRVVPDPADWDTDLVFKLAD